VTTHIASKQDSQHVNIIIFHKNRSVIRWR